MTKRKKLWTAAILIIIAALVFFLFAYVTLPRTGTVIDAQTGQPIKGAVVCYYWQKTDILGPAGCKLYETVTNENGRYFIPPLIIWRLFPLYEINPPTFLIYKDGYVAIKDNVSFYGEKFELRLIGNTVKLQRWRDGIRSHADHLEFMEQFEIGDIMKNEMSKEDYRVWKERYSNKPKGIQK